MASCKFLAGDLRSTVSFVAGQKSTPLVSVIKAGLVEVKSSDAIVQSALDEATLRGAARLGAAHWVSVGHRQRGDPAGAAWHHRRSDQVLRRRVAAWGRPDAQVGGARQWHRRGDELHRLRADNGGARSFLAILNGRTQQIVDELHETAVSVMNLVVNNRDKLRN